MGKTLDRTMSSYRQTRTAPAAPMGAPRALSAHSQIRTRSPSPPTGAAPPARFEASVARAPPPRPVSPGRDIAPRAIRPSEDLNRGASPVKLRMHHLSNRLAGLQDELDAEKKTSIDDKNIKRMRIEHRYTKPRLPMPTDDDRISMLAEQVAVCRKELADLIASREEFEEQSTKVVKAVENHINLDLTVEKRARKDLEAKMLKYAEDLVGSLRADLELEKKLRNEAATTYQQTLEDILEISKNIDLETEARKQQEVNIDKHLMDEVALLKDLLDQIRQKRETLEYAFKEKLDNEFMALNLELERERRLRAKMEMEHQRELQVEIESVRQLIADNQKMSENEETSLVVQIAEESDGLKKLLLEEHAARDDSEKSVVRLLEDMYTKLHKEVEEERRDRENTQEKFIKMLEGLVV